MRILAPVDPADETFPVALRAAVRLTGPDDELHVVHLVSPPVQWYSAPSGPEASGPELARVRRSLEDALENRGAPNAKVTVAHADTAHIGDAIVRIAKSVEADLIVIPTHGRRGFSRVVLGSVAERVVRLAHCDVYVVRVPRED